MVPLQQTRFLNFLTRVTKGCRKVLTGLITARMMKSMKRKRKKVVAMSFDGQEYPMFCAPSSLLQSTPSTSNTAGRHLFIHTRFPSPTEHFLLLQFYTNHRPHHGYTPSPLERRASSREPPPPVTILPGNASTPRRLDPSSTVRPHASDGGGNDCLKNLLPGVDLLGYGDTPPGSKLAPFFCLASGASTVGAFPVCGFHGRDSRMEAGMYLNQDLPSPTKNTALYNKMCKVVVMVEYKSKISNNAILTKHFGGAVVNEKGHVLVVSHALPLRKEDIVQMNIRKVGDETVWPTVCLAKDPKKGLALLKVEVKEGDELCIPSQEEWILPGKKIFCVSQLFGMFECGEVSYPHLAYGEKKNPFKIEQLMM
ncbi:hypothetical protein RHSIM_Rhsim04G0090300 [Rhododendron simsii]|uniref:Trypsin family protein n=1 Tax=Rhododendron simsii TaxID=118357 RepID=A0A834H6R7_RHOSS|nr:hypothetical protein RHSIM_Rhsim04G0090300 [Rhododendron simsii]